MRVAGRAGRRLFANTADGILQGIDKGKRNRGARLGKVVLERLIDIAARPLAQDNRLAAHLRPDSRSRTRARSRSK